MGWGPSSRWPYEQPSSQHNQSEVLDFKKRNANYFVSYHIRFRKYLLRFYPVKSLGFWLVCWCSALAGGCSSDQTLTDLAILHTPATDPLTPTANQPILLTATVTNRDGDWSSTTTVAIRVDGVVVARVPLDAIPGRGTQQITASFSIATTGAHSIAVIVDPDQQLNDEQWSNNTAIFSLSVGIATSG
jgi:hypothetical protein